MKPTSIAAGVFVAAVSAFFCIVFPTGRVISVGDDATALDAFERHGYPKAAFSLPAFPEKINGRLVTFTFFDLGNEQYLRVWHDDRIAQMMQFQAVPHEHAYSDWINQQYLKSYRIRRPRLSSYCVGFFAGMAASAAAGWAIRRFTPAYPTILAALFSLAVLGSLAAAMLLEMAATFSVFASIAWVAAFIFGASVLQSSRTS
jgi:hypothetical protein